LSSDAFVAVTDDIFSADLSFAERTSYPLFRITRAYDRLDLLSRRSTETFLFGCTPLFILGTAFYLCGLALRALSRFGMAAREPGIPAGSAMVLFPGHPDAPFRHRSIFYGVSNQAPVCSILLRQCNPVNGFLGISAFVSSPAVEILLPKSEDG
jgi:hypothetical protein